MSGSSIGTIFKLTTFGESHGKALGGIIEGCPAGIEINLDLIQDELNRRRPGQSELVSARNEKDQVEFLSGIFEGKSSGTPIGFTIHNQDQNSKDYSHLKDAYRPSHADYTYEKKYGIRDYRGGGRSSARETVCRVVAGALAKQVLDRVGIDFSTYVVQIGKVILESEAKCFGNIIFKKRGDHGFGYDPIFEESSTRLTFAEMDNNMKDLYSHRARALKKIIPNLLKIFS